MSDEPYFEIDSIGRFSNNLSVLRGREERDEVITIPPLAEYDLFFRVEALVLLDGTILFVKAHSLLLL